MSDTSRLLIVGAVVVIAAGAVFFSRRRRALLRTLPASLGPFPTVVVFGSETCLSCAPVISELRDAGVSFVGYDWESHRQLFERMGIDEVPRVIAADAGGRVVVDVRGELGRRDIARLRHDS